ncbi:hypothetical protein OKA04_12315 [Luteolibacter flavescens]|uniref:Uncharacterized protein n=1 Tax=Luteolibacter flavescens TaxID=1859460 RepID=A0ABT3FPL2_9BACT|nr:hypothetical protein [Luteolibacter flavescens]MCW1885515.1 hypothetical protein [Luteolibacter flavescens]
MSAQQQRILIVLSAEDGVFLGASETTDSGSPIPLDLAALAALLPALNAAAVTRVGELEGEAMVLADNHATALKELAQSKDMQRISELADLAQQHADEIARLTAVPEPPPSTLLSDLNAVFRAAVPVELQGSFGIAFATVRVLLQADETDLARATIEAIEVPPELAEAKAAMMELIPSSTAEPES